MTGTRESRRLTNWAGNVAFAAARVHRPTSVDELQAIVAGSGRLRALGTGHCFSPAADTTGDLVCVAGLPQRVELAADRRSVAVSAGMRYGEVAAVLQSAGLALPNLASLPHLSVAGAVATGSHGSGDTLGSLATAVRGLELVTPAGTLLRLDREADGDRFPGAVVAVGCLGVVTGLQLDVVPTYDVRQWVYEDLALQTMEDRFDDVFASAQGVSAFTTWQRDTVEQVWLACRPGDPEPGPRWFGATPADGPRHPVAGQPAQRCTPQGGVPGPWHERLPHFRLGYTPSSGAELQSEYLLDRSHARAALRVVRTLAAQLRPVLQVCQVRTVAADDLWLSPSQGRDSVCLHFTWYDDAAAVAPVVAALEHALAPFAARPHWGKVFGTHPDVLRALYPRWQDFARLRGQLDPAGVMRSEWTDRYLPAAV